MIYSTGIYSKYTSNKTKVFFYKEINDLKASVFLILVQLNPEQHIPVEVRRTGTFYV